MSLMVRLLVFLALVSPAAAQTDSYLASNGTFKTPFALTNTWTAVQTFNVAPVFGVLPSVPLAQFQVLQGNGSGVAAPVTFSAAIDAAVGSTRGSILERGVSGWQIVTPGTSGLPWVSNGTGSDPGYQALTAPNVNFTQSGTGAVQRTLSSVLQEKWPSLQDFGAACNGSTNDATALSNAVAAFGSVYVGGPGGSSGTQCKVSTLSSALTGKLFGQNAQIVDGSGNQRGYFFSAVSANQPYTATNENSIETAFNGNFTGSQFAVEHRITGATTLTQPTTGYVYSPWAYPYYTYLFNSSGWNNSTTDNTGRTAAVAYRTRVYNHGQGDMMAFNCSGFVDTTRSGATGSTGWLANPAVSCIGGDLTAGANGTYLNPLEFILTDAGFDAAAIGPVINLQRTNNTGNLGVVWGGFTAQSIGSKAVDFGYRLTGPVVTGIDLTAATYPNVSTINAAMVMTGGARIYWNGSQSGTYFVNAGTTFQDYDPVNACMQFSIQGKLTICPDSNGHIRAIGSSPTVTAGCGTSPSVSGSDFAGLLSTGSTASTTCTITFATAYNNTPYCYIWPNGTNVAGLATFNSNPSTTTLVFNYTSATNFQINYECYARAAG
jgi:hypothetical protein